MTCTGRSEGKLSVRIAFATMGLLGAIGYAIQVQRRGEPGTEFDWRTAAKAWQDLQLTPGSTARRRPDVDAASDRTVRAIRAPSA